VSLRGLLALILLLAGAIGALYWLDHKKKPAAALPTDAPLVHAFTEDAVKGIELACEGAVVTVRRTSGGFALERPFAAEADRRRVHELVAALQDARVRKVIEEKAADLSAYGLSPPTCAVKVELDAGAPPIALNFGRSSPVGTERYAAAGDARVVFADGSLYSVVSRGSEALREKRLFPVEPDAITRIAIERPDGTLILEKKQDAWTLVAPFADAASSSSADALARAIASMEVTDAATTQAPSVVQPGRRIKITIGTKDGAAPRSADVAVLGIEGKRLAWREGGGLAGLLAEPAAAELARPVDSYREMHIASFSVPDVRSITVDRGAVHLRLTRDAEGKPWTGLDGAAPFTPDDGRVVTLLDRLRSVTASGIAGQPPASAATATVTIGAPAGELARLSYGPLPRMDGADGETLWVTTPARPGVVFTIPAASLGPIPARASDLAKAPSL